MKKNEKGFTLIELLAVIVILGVLAMVGIPAVSRYINNSKKQVYIATVKTYAQSVQKAYDAGLLDCSGETGKFYVSFSDAKKLIESGGNSPFGGAISGSIHIEVDSLGKATYYVFSKDDQNFGTSLIEAKDLNPNNRNLIQETSSADSTASYTRCRVK